MLVDCVTYRNIFPYSGPIHLASIPQEHRMELLPSLVHSHGCLNHDLLLCDGVLCQADLPQGRKCSQHIRTKILHLLSAVLQAQITLVYLLQDIDCYPTPFDI